MTQPNPMEDPARRFDRFERLVGPKALERLRCSHVLVVGLGGVGSWAAEAVARSGVGRLSVVDFDTVCIRNFNRQLQALSGCIGKPKAPLLAERLRLANPEADIRGIQAFFDKKTCETLLAEQPDFVVDAIDHVTSKCLLIKTCKDRGIPMVVSTGSGGRLDPSRVRLADLSRTEVDPLAHALRGILRKKHGFPLRGPFGVLAAYSPEKPLPPHEGFSPNDCKARCLCPQGSNGLQDCGKKHLVVGTAAFVTGAFGLLCASAAIRTLIGQDPLQEG
ncbi:MAG TPA: tRNA threonylcarbamoyladenosine dehydratase [Elusimicrobia bacterium]|nr:tRNA threonylcarbamoyladenosine dehydratase [Elusimicrobiota bacterium]